LDLEKNFMRYAGAGQPPVLQWRISTVKPQKGKPRGRPFSKKVAIAAEKPQDSIWSILERI